MKRLLPLRRSASCLVLAGSALLAACGGGGDSSPAVAAEVLKGTAAVGLPIVGGTVDVRCAGGSALGATTSSSGGWQVTLSGQTLPCAVQVSGGTVGGGANTNTYQSIAMSVGTINITPLTSLVVAQVTGANPQTWFAAPSFTAFSTTAMANAISNLVTRLGLGTALGSADPLTTPFEANGSDTLDKILDALGDALTASSQTYAALLAAAQANDFAAFSGFPAAFNAAWTTSPGGGTGACATDETAATYSGSAGTYSDGQSVCFNATTTQLGFLGKTLGSPVQNTLVMAPFSAYAFTDTNGDVYEVVFNEGALYEINYSDSASYRGQFVPAGSGGSGTGGGMTGGVSFSASLGGISELANSLATTEVTNNTTTQVVTYKQSWGNVLDSVQLIVSHATTQSALFGEYQILTINLAKASPLLSAQLNANAGACVLQATSQTILNAYQSCSALGITYDRSAGTVDFNATPMRDMVGSHGSFTVSGQMEFSAY